MTRPQLNKPLNPLSRAGDCWKLVVRLAVEDLKKREKAAQHLTKLNETLS